MALWKKNEVSVDIAHYRHYWRAPKKWGKTTLFANLIQELYGDMDKGLLISCGNERGYSALDGIVYVDCPEWSDIAELVDELIENKEENSFVLLGFDTVDELVAMAQREVIKLDFRKTGERHEFNAAFGGYGAGRRKVDEMINSLITRLGDSGFGLIFIGHSKIRDVKEKNGDEYQMLTSNLSSDYDGIFANKADICMMGVIEKEIDGGFVQGAERYMIFRGNGYVDAGGRFADIDDRVEVSAKNYIKTVTDAIKKSIKSHVVTDEYIEQKLQQERQEKEDFYKANKERLMQDDSSEDSFEKDITKCQELRSMIYGTMQTLSKDEQKSATKQLGGLGLPCTKTAIDKLTDTAILTQILETIKSE